MKTLEKKYFANFSCNNGTTLMKAMESTNKKKLAQSISASARAECFHGNCFTWRVWDEKEEIVAAGSGKKSYKGSVSYYSMQHIIGRKLEEI